MHTSIQLECLSRLMTYCSAAGYQRLVKENGKLVDSVLEHPNALLSVWQTEKSILFLAFLKST